MRQSIRERLEELESERDQLQRALAALTGGVAAPRRRGRPPGSGSAKPAAGRRASGRRAPRGQRREQVLGVLENKELGPSAIAREVGVNPTQISGLLRQLASEGLVARGEGGKWRRTGAASQQAGAAGAAAAQAAGAGGDGGSPDPAGGGSDSIS
jgi:hypothetical protein